MAQLHVRIDDNLKEQLQSLARREGKSASEVVRALVQRYVRDRDRSAALRALWNQMERRVEEEESGPQDVEEAIQSVRERGRSGSSPEANRT